MPGETVNVDNFVRAESNRMFSALLADTRGVSRWWHSRVPTPLDHQPVLRPNRDTLYSAAIVEISAGATLTIPESGDRHISLMPVNQDHYFRSPLPAHRARRAGRRVLVDLGLQRRLLMASPLCRTTTDRSPSSSAMTMASPTACPSWIYLVRLYQPRPEVLDGSWTFPVVEAA